VAEAMEGDGILGCQVMNRSLDEADLREKRTTIELESTAAHYEYERAPRPEDLKPRRLVRAHC
jgi:hypothetical protein